MGLSFAVSVRGFPKESPLWMTGAFRFSRDHGLISSRNAPFAWVEV